MRAGTIGLFALGCGAGGAGVGTGPAPVEEVCETDGECSGDEICEEAECVRGDRSVDAATAVTVAFDDDASGEINPAGDTDWYAFDADAGTFARVHVDSYEDDNELDTVVALYGPDLELLAWEDEHPAGSVATYDSVLFAYLADGGRYYVEVQDRSTFYGETPVGGADSAYTLTVLELRGHSETDTPQSTGYDLTVETDTIYGIPVAITDAGDADFTRIDVGWSDTWLQFVGMQNDVGSALAPLYELYDRDGALVLSKADPVAGDSAALIGTTGTRYVLGVSDAAGDGGPDHWTFAFVRVGAEGAGYAGEAEPNDAVGDATLFTLEDLEPDSGTAYGAAGEGRVGTADDVDVWALDVPFDGAYVSVLLDAQRWGGLLVARVELLDAAGEVLAVADGSQGTDPALYDAGPFDAGTLYARISAVPDAGVAGGEGCFYQVLAYATSWTIGD